MAARWHADHLRQRRHPQGALRIPRHPRANQLEQEVRLPGQPLHRQAPLRQSGRRSGASRRGLLRRLGGRALPDRVLPLRPTALRRSLPISGPVIPRLPLPLERHTSLAARNRRQRQLERRGHRLCQLERGHGSQLLAGARWGFQLEPRARGRSSHGRLRDGAARRGRLRRLRSAGTVRFRAGARDVEPRGAMSSQADGSQDLPPSRWRMRLQ